MQLFTKKTGLVTLMVLLVLTTAVTLVLFYGSEFSKETKKGDNWVWAQDRINILLLGTDQELGIKSRTDSIIVASIDTKNKKVGLLSIPRDTLVNIPGYGENKINAANQLAGVNLVKETLEKLTRVPIDHYILTNFTGFKEIVDALGGVEIDVEQDMKYHVYDGMIDLKKGQQRLDGDKALQYVRFRHDKLGDISRTQRQQKFLVALAKEMTRPKNLIKLPLLVPKLPKAVKTDLSVSQMISLARDAENYDSANITVQTLPGNFATIKGVSYWCVDTQKAHQVVLELFAGKADGQIIDTAVNLGSGTTKSQTSGSADKKQVNKQGHNQVIKPTLPKPKGDEAGTVPCIDLDSNEEPVPINHSGTQPDEGSNQDTGSPQPINDTDLIESPDMSVGDHVY